MDLPHANWHEAKAHPGGFYFNPLIERLSGSRIGSVEGDRYTELAEDYVRRRRAQGRGPVGRHNSRARRVCTGSSASISARQCRSGGGPQSCSPAAVVACAASDNGTGRSIAPRLGRTALTLVIDRTVLPFARDARAPGAASLEGELSRRPGCGVARPRRAAAPSVLTDSGRGDFDASARLRLA